MVRPSFPVVAAALALTVFVASCAVARPVVVAGPQAPTSPIVRVSTLAAVASPIAVAAPPEPSTSELATTDLATTAVATTTPASVPEATTAAPPSPAPPTLAPAAPTLVTDVAPWPVEFGPL